MDLLEEYHIRHKLTSPLIRFPNHGYLLCRHKARGEAAGDSRFIVFFINFHKKADTPPYLCVSCNTPLHDNGSGGGGLGSGSNPHKTLWNKRIEFEEWENFVTEWTDSLKGNLTVIKPDEILLAIWEIFIYTNDHWLSQNLPPNLYDSLTQVIDESCKMEERIESTKVIESWLNGRMGRGSQSMLTTLTKTYDPQSHATWLASMLSMGAETTVQPVN